MSADTDMGVAPAGTGATATPGIRTARTTAAGRLRALGRAEFTLLLRNRTALVAALIVPVTTILALKTSLRGVDLDKTGMTIAEVSMTGGIGITLLMAVYSNLTGAYTARREDLVLKRLRTLEASDREILAGTALPAVSLAFAQIVVLIGASIAFLGLRAPQRADLLVLGVLGGLVLLAALAALTSAVTRTVESAQITAMPVFLISLLGSGLFVPLRALPDGLASFCELLPVTGVMTLIRAGWLGGSGAYELLGAGLNALAWIVIALFAVRRWFRWESRR